MAETTDETTDESEQPTQWEIRVQAPHRGLGLRDGVMETVEGVRVSYRPAQAEGRGRYRHFTVTGPLAERLQEIVSAYDQHRRRADDVFRSEVE